MGNKDNITVFVSGTPGGVNEVASYLTEVFRNASVHGPYIAKLGNETGLVVFTGRDEARAPDKLGPDLNQWMDDTVWTTDAVISGRAVDEIESGFALEGRNLWEIKVSMRPGFTPVR